MKKPLLTVLTLLTSSLCIWADPVDRAKAKEIATAYMRGNQPPELIETSIAKRKGTDGHAPLYIFNRGNDQGFVIISGDDCMPYVLGYTEKGDFDPQTLPPAMLDWLEGYSRMIEAAQAQGLGPRVQTRANDKENIAPLVSAHWSQGAPYNNLCPYMSNGSGRALTGCVAGFALGTFLFPKVIWYAYGMLYKMDSLVYVFDWKLAVISVIVSLLCSIGTTFVSVRRELTEVAAELMRPKTPKAGKRVFLEYIPFVWKRLKFLQKVSMRNIFRYKKRFFMMVAGISGCSALLVTGFGVRDSVTGIVTQQYTQIQTYDIGVTYSSSVTPEQKSELESKEQDGVEKSVFVAEKSMDLVGSEKTKSVSLIIADPDSDMTPFVNLHTEKGVPITFPKKGEAVISAKVADELGIKTGDTVTLQDSDMKTISVTVSGLCENFVYNYVYLSADTYEEQMKTEPEYKNAFVCVSEGTDAHLLGTSLMAMSDVAAVNISQDDMERFSSMMGSMDLIVVVIILCAAGLAFIVLYNLTNINITERVCEIATIEVLGFYENETAAYVFRENTILTFLGALAGLVLGVFLHRFVMSQIVVDMVAFDVHVKPVSFVYSVVLTLVFTWFVDRLMRKKIDAISMTESLKSVD